MHKTLYNSVVLNNSLELRELVKKLNSGSEVNIHGFNIDYLGLLIGITGLKNVLVLTDDQIRARQLSTMLDKWKMKHVLLPCSWSLLELEGLLEISTEINNFYDHQGTVMVMSSEEWNTDWMYRFEEDKKLVVNNQYSFNDLSKKLTALGYTRVDVINLPGEYAIKGDVWTIKTNSKDVIIKLDFSGKTLHKIEQIEIDKVTGCKNIVIPGALIRTEEKKWAKKDVAKNIDFELVIRVGDTKEVQINGAKKINIGVMDNKPEIGIDWQVEKMLFNLGGQTNFLECLKKYKINKSLVVTQNPDEFRRWINELNLKFSDFEIVTGSIPCGGIIRSDNLALWSDLELFGRVEEQKAKNKGKLNFKKLAEYKIGDLVVHLDHGVGMLKDFSVREINGIKKDYLVILYDRGDLLYVPVEQLNKISKYIGSKLMRLNRLGGRIWLRRKRRAKKDVEIIARELLKLYAKRKLVHRKAYSIQKSIMERLNKSFNYELTVDQDIALDEINKDLDKSYPMDRLLCGDVGFGKTELAIRIAARVAANRKQVALLAPTTILCEQHFVTFVSRLSGLNLRVAVLSRLRDKKYQEQVVAEIKKGKVDIVIGTHRLLQKDINYKNLGLLIIDEEQKFGVRAKEKLKEIRSDVDVLSMSATPIPRTLNISMGGVRDMSILEIPPVGRQTIETEVMQYNSGLVKDAIERELARSGQVYIVHNRVRTIARYREELEKILPKTVTIGMAHGQMTEVQLADTMSKFATNKYQILLATTIVENGLDLPNVNTLIVENASGLGLSQLYQLRGRVGRSDKKAYAYFLYRSDKLKNKAKQRLTAISEATELGSGLKLAISDMEIRGVGNVLGVEQHGNAYAVGLGMFLDMLEETVDKLKNGEEETVIDEGDILIDLPVDVYIPKYYIENREDSLYWEQRMAVQSKETDVDQVLYEIQTKYTGAPQELINLSIMTKLKISCGKNGIKSVVFEKASNGKIEDGMVVLTINQNNLMGLIEKLFKYNSMWLVDGEKIKISIKNLGKDWFEKLYQILTLK